jgi:hypothetical protein
MKYILLTIIFLLAVLAIGGTLLAGINPLAADEPCADLWPHPEPQAVEGGLCLTYYAEGRSRMVFAADK